jgi:hypothetical protein
MVPAGHAYEPSAAAAFELVTRAMLHVTGSMREMRR